ncbi:MAG: PAS domain-containing protein [Chitinophagales bacterium]|nr:PAS domain-containing protein [Chitinophagales bacterium]
MSEDGQASYDKEEKLNPEGLRVADQIPALLAYWDSGLTCRYINNKSAEWFGKARESVIDKMSLEDFLGTTLFIQQLPTVQSVLKGQAQFAECKLTIQQTARHCLINFLPDKQDGTINGFFFMITDIGLLRAKTDKQLADEKALLRSIITIQEEERSGIADKLRDNVNQLLVYVNLMLQGTKNEHYTPAFTEEMRLTIQQAITELNLLSNHLYPSGLNLLGLLPSLENLLSSYRITNPETDISLACNTETIEDLEEPEKLSVYRIVQDFLTLIMQQRKCRLIQTELSYRDRCLMLRILFDNAGNGIDKASNAFRDIQSRIDYYNGKIRGFGDSDEQVYIIHLVFSREASSEIN